MARPTTYMTRASSGRSISTSSQRSTLSGNRVYLWTVVLTYEQNNDDGNKTNDQRSFKDRADNVMYYVH
ncbi:hypothetical protein RDWZM_010606 [Blomia tropicalis]|uniref:Uncharacterized protein n=1 Tax=Blomia tropicalis TaxID=40697 RepID=A0A9Q0LZI3_BLOTA|nr:hypothetical protein RDWZM_010606 [Blomia tropicalis]